ncbi:MAG: N-acetyltransferase family protein [Solirubrobacteraceae bacterium]
MLASLRNGLTVEVREVRATDSSALGAFLEGLSLESRRLRFFTGGADIAGIADSIGAPGRDRLGLVAIGRDGALIGHALCIETGERRAEVAIEVADELHGQGLGTILLERLGQLAERRGIRTFVAEVLPENHEMLEVFRDGFDARVAWTDGVDEVEFPTGAWRLARQRFSDPACHARPGLRGSSAQKGQITAAARRKSTDARHGPGT